ncbi:MAG: hypothetical protein HY280_10790 [Nitrospinae bacterium]|nr:hypothetical protein [Nitrospinota bacterium]
MKINGLTPQGSGGETGKKVDAPITGPSFGSVLQEAGKSGQTSGPKAPQAVGLPPPLSPISGNTTGQIANQAVTMLENTLGDLQMYQNAMANPGVPASSLKPMSQNLMDAKNNLVSYLPKVNDKALKEMISQTASLILSENTRVNSPT